LQRLWWLHRPTRVHHTTAGVKASAGNPPVHPQQFIAINSQNASSQNQKVC